jgi:hypothetical protein
LKDWPGRDRLPPAARVFDGIALAGVIRAAARNAELSRPIIALNTGHAGDFSDLPQEIREHAIARAHNLEWVFLKHGSRSKKSTADRILELADAQARLPEHWDARNGEQALLAILGGRSEELGDVLDAWPPVREIGRDTGGVAILRWLLHRILPYPCFLIDETYAAARLGVTVDSFRAAVDAGTPFADAFAACRYGGILCRFDGPRWWRSRVETALWDVSASRVGPAAFNDLNELACGQLEPIATPNGVVVLGSDYVPHQEPISPREAVRIHLDDWPPYAEDAWASREDVLDDPDLRHRVVPSDRRSDG